MDHHRQWRPTPRPTHFQPNLCPSCLIPHFPHCPPPPPLPSSTFQPPPPPPFNSPTPPNFHPYPNFPPHHQNPNSDSDRSFKRPRIDDPFNLSDDQRRLKLIRDHGIAFSNNHHSHHPLPPYPPPHHVPFPPQETNGTLVHNPYPYHPYTYPTDIDASRSFRAQPPLPSSPPPPLPIDPPKNPPSLFPVSEPHPLPQHYFQNKPPLPEFSTGFPPVSKQYLGNAQPFSLNQFSAEKPKFVDATQLFRHPHRASRPDHFVIILRGLPGSGKSHLAKMLRDLEVENGGVAPRIHSMDDYFMTEVEKFEISDGSKSSSSGRSKKPVTKKVMEYCYEPEMEEAYRSSMLKAFKKTVEEGDFTFIIEIGI